MEILFYFLVLYVQCVFSFCVDPIARATKSPSVLKTTEGIKASLLRSLSSDNLDKMENRPILGNKKRGMNWSNVERKSVGPLKALMNFVFPSTEDLLSENLNIERLSHTFDSSASTNNTPTWNEPTSTGGVDSPGQDYFNYHISWLKSPTFSTGSGMDGQFSQLQCRQKDDKSVYVAGFWDYDPKAAAASSRNSRSTRTR